MAREGRRFHGEAKLDAGPSVARIDPDEEPKERVNLSVARDGVN
jgi:hypothetical protein